MVINLSDRAKGLCAEHFDAKLLLKVRIDNLKFMFSQCGKICHCLLCEYKHVFGWEDMNGNDNPDSRQTLVLYRLIYRLQDEILFFSLLQI